MTNKIENINRSIGVAACLTEMTKEDAWAFAMGAVDYPVYFLPLFIDKKDAELSEENEYLPATGVTNTGRDSTFFGVVVDRLRDGELSTIATVTGLYGTIPTKNIYEDFMRDLDAAGLNSKPVSVYVSGDGGRAVLRIKIEGMDTPYIGSDRFHMAMDLYTSVDGSTRYQVELNAVNQDGVAVMGVVDSVLSVSARHTTTIQDRHLAFGTIISKLSTEWNDLIAPTLRLFGQSTLDRTSALGIVENMLEDADIPERHIEAAKYNVENGGGSSVLTVLTGVSEYFNEAMADKPERLQFFKRNIMKAAKKTLKKYTQ